MLRKFLILPLVMAAVLAGCGSGGSYFDPGPIIPDGESSLYDPVNNPTGLLPRRGSGAVMMLLESQAGPRAPIIGDTASVGVDEVWFEVTTPGFVDLQLDAESLLIASRVEILDKNGVRMLLVDKDHLTGHLDLPLGRYILRLQSAALTDPVPANVLVWFGEPMQVTPNANDLGRVMLPSVNCTDCDLRGANLSGANLVGANLTRANMRGAMLAKASGDGFVMSPAAIFKLFLSGASLVGADLRDANLTDADLTGAFLSGAGKSFANFSGANLTRVKMPKLYLNHANFASPATNMTSVDLSGASLIGADLHGVNITGANFMGANLRSANLRGVNMTGTDLRNALLNGADFTGANLSGLSLAGADLTGATWTNGLPCASGSIGVCVQP